MTPDEAFDGPTHAVGGAHIRVVDAQSAKAISMRHRRDRALEAMSYPQLMDRLRTLLETYYPPHLIAVLAGWGLRTAVGPRGVGDRAMIEGMFQHHVELLQAVALSLPSEEWGSEPAPPPAIQETIDLALALPDAFVATRMKDGEAKPDETAATVRSLQERLRMHTQMVRNWGSYRSMLDLLRKQYAPLDTLLRKRNGFGALDVISVIEEAVSSVESQVNDRFQLLKDIFKAATIPDLVRDFFNRYPGVTGDPDAYLSVLHADEKLESVRARLLAHADRWLVVSAIAPVEKIARTCGVSEETTRTILDLISMTAGALSEENPDHFFLSNPIWTKPGLKTGDDYFFAFPHTAVSFLSQILSSLFADADLKGHLQKRRATFLEEETLGIVTQALPGASITPEAKWSWQGKGYETDVLVVLDRTVVIIECKSASLSPQGLRGAPDRVRRHVGDLVVEPAVQSARLASIITLGQKGDDAALKVTRLLGIEPSEINATIRISVTLDDLTVLSSAEVELKAAGWIPDGLELPTTLNIADLACVADVLDRPSLFLDYFDRRSRLQKTADVIGFELDLLGLYLATNFDLGETDGHLLVIPEMSNAIDRHYQNREIGHPSDKPAPLLHPFIRGVLLGLEERRPRGWTTMAMDLLSVGELQSQTECADAFEALRLDVLAGSISDRVNGFFITPDLRDDVVIVFHAFARAERNAGKEQVFLLAEHALTESGRSRCLFVSRMVETWDVTPYDAIGVIRSRV
ncbi:hypothetical protein [Rhizobium sp. BR 315]|uniref:hypothetical protein n=1 Tax=Rhizobium sp. BR 315 TaxID=3040014 RepID=UPI003D353E6D